MVDTVGRDPLSITTTGSLQNTAQISNAGKNSGISNFLVTYETVNYHTNFGAGGYEASGSFLVVQSIQLPDGRSYSFTYDSGTTAGHYGDLLSMTLPTGSTINFTYTNFFDSEFAQGWTHHVTRMLSTMTTPDGVWQFSPSVLTQCTITIVTCKQQLQVTKPTYNGRNDIEIYKSVLPQFKPNLYPFEADYYNGSVSSSNLLATVTQSFDFSQTCTGAPWYITMGTCTNVTPLSKTVSLPMPGGTSINRTTQYCYDIVYGNLLKKWEWNFYTGAIISDPNPPTSPSSCSIHSGVTAPDRTTTYAYLGGSNYLSSTRNIANRPTSITVTNSSGSTVAQTVNSYDGATLVTSGATGIINHDDTNFGSGLAYRGNVTQIQELISGSSNYVTKSMTYDITGQLRTETDWTNLSTHQTSYSYSDTFYTDGGDTTNPPGTYTPSPATNAYLTQVTLPTVNSVTLTENFGYYWGTGQQALSKDPNGQKTFSHFYDLLNRPTSTILPATAPGTGWSYYAYNSTETQVDVGTGITSSTLATSCTPSAGDCRHDQILNDSMGRTTSSVLVSDPDGGTTSTTSYDSNGRVYQVSNPYRSTSDTTYGLTTFAYDGMDRKIQATQPDGSMAYTFFGAPVGTNGGLSTQQCSGYGIGYPILSKDEAGKVRQLWTDGFGRLIEVDEPSTAGSLSSGYSTCYGYDLNNNLTSVVQGSETRTFKFDLASRLLSTTNPENGTTCYYYTTTAGTCGTASTGSLCSGDPSAVCLRSAPQANQAGSATTTTTYSYDALNRLTSISYNDPTPTTPTVRYGYDAVALSGCTTTPPTLSIANGLGRRTSMCDGSGGTSWSFDAVGNASTEKRTLNSLTNTTQYTYNLDSTLSSIQYPSGPSNRTVAYAPGGAQRPFSAIDAAHSINYGTSAHYSAPGQLASLTNNGSISFTAIYNPQMSVCWNYATSGTALPWNSTTCSSSATVGSVVDMKFAYNAGTSDNGNVVTMTNNRDTTRSQAFTYDGLNRLSVGGTVNTSGTNCWDEQYTIDRFGNLSASSAASGYNAGCTGERWSLSVNSGNQLQSSTAPYYGYDAAGNLTSMPAPASAAYSYNGENRMRQAVTSATFGYVYDGDGNRVEKTNSGTVTKLYWNDVGGNALDETDGSGNLTSEYVFLGGSRIARRDASSNIYYYYADQIGSTRVITNSSGTVCFDADFSPFGFELADYTSSCVPTYKFTGAERDGSLTTETGLDHLGARQYASLYGRFITPDPAGNAVADPSNPLSWNQYSYVFNNPENATDPSGLCTVSGSAFASGDDADSGAIDGGSYDCQSKPEDLEKDPNANSDTKAAGTCQGLMCWVLKGVSAAGSGIGDSGRSWNEYSNQMEFSSLFQGSSRGIGGKSGTNSCAQVPTGTPTRYCGPLEQGLDAAKNALQKNSCNAFYGGQGQQTLDSTTYRFLSMNNPNTGAATIDSNTVFINSTGPYMNYAPVPGKKGPFGRSWTQSQFRGFILLHELGHQLSSSTGFMPDSTDLNLNQAQSRRVIGTCF